MTTHQHEQASEHFLAQARQELAAGDLPQASEKGLRQRHGIATLRSQ